MRHRLQFQTARLFKTSRTAVRPAPGALGWYIAYSSKLRDIRHFTVRGCSHRLQSQTARLSCYLDRTFPNGLHAVSVPNEDRACSIEFLDDQTAGGGIAPTFHVLCAQVHVPLSIPENHVPTTDTRGL